MNKQNASREFEKLLTMMDELRKKCPWDKKQTLETLRPLTIEETYELSHAIIEKNSGNIEASMEKIKKELGDLLLHIVFYSKIASEQNSFTITDVIESLCKKLIHRHPHIYGDVSAETSEQVKENWEKLKLKEGNRSVMEGVPQALPAMVKAMRIQEKARAVGFDWENRDQVWDKVVEELNEFKNVSDSDPEERISEFGDVLFALINYSRFIDVDPEMALELTNKKFIERFRYMEQKATSSGKALSEMTLHEMDGLWDEAKKI